MKIQKGHHFSLLEVLIALMIITASLPLLLTPFIYATTDQMETVQRLRKEKTVLYYLITILGELHSGSIPFSQLDGEQAYPFKPEWKGEDWKELPVTGTYQFKKLKDKTLSESQTLELYQITLEIIDGVGKNASSSTFNYEFVVKKGKEQAAAPKSEEKSDEA